MHLIDYTPINQPDLAAVGYTARWATYEGCEEFAEILNQKGEVVEHVEAWDIAEARRWVHDRTPQVLLDLLA